MFSKVDQNLDPRFSSALENSSQNTYVDGSKIGFAVPLYVLSLYVIDYDS